MTLREQLSFFDELCFLVFLDNRHEGPKKKKNYYEIRDIPVDRNRYFKEK